MSEEIRGKKPVKIVFMFEDGTKKVLINQELKQWITALLMGVNGNLLPPDDKQVMSLLTQHIIREKVVWKCKGGRTYD